MQSDAESAVVLRTEIDGIKSAIELQLPKLPSLGCTAIVVHVRNVEHAGHEVPLLQKLHITKIMASEMADTRRYTQWVAIIVPLCRGGGEGGPSGLPMF